MHPFLPELVSDVLLRLPVKSLLRFRCLSTSLCSEIDSPNFAKNHLNRSIQSKIRQKVIIDYKNGTHFYALDFDGGLKEATILKYPFKSPSGNAVTISGSCNGLILLALGKTKLTLWNPFTKRHKKIPPCPAETLPGYKCAYRLGLGHDPAHDDYKIVLISVFHGYRFTFQSWVFSLKKNSWRRRQNPRLKLQNKLTSKASFANGALYWQCNDGDNRKIVGFDLTKEAFFKMPTFLNTEFLIYYNTMVVFGGKLYITEITSERKTLEFYLNVSDKGRLGYCKEAFQIEDKEIQRALNENYAADAWYSLDLPWPLAYSKDGDSILFYKKNEVFWYNPETKSRKRVEILGIPRAQSEGYSFHVCWENLVSLGNESVFDAAPEKSRMETLREIAAANMIGKNLARLGCLICCYILIFGVVFFYYAFALYFAVTFLWLLSN